MFHKQTVRDIDLEGKTVLLHAELDAPLDSSGQKVTSDFRIKGSSPTIKYLQEQNCKIILISKLGRPNGKVNAKMSLAPVAKRLSTILDQKVGFVNDCVGPAVIAAAQELLPKHIILLENLRFHFEEEANDETFARAIVKDTGAEIFVQDCFALAHRKEAGTDAITKVLPSVGGLHLEEEVNAISKAMETPERPLAAIIGGAKIADKIEILERFIAIADFVAVGGALANTFLAAQGVAVGESLFIQDDIPLAKEIMHKAAEETKKRPFVFAIPHDCVVATDIDKTAATRIVDFSSHTFADIEHYPKRVPAEAIKLHVHEKILDIGPFSASFIAGGIQLAKTVVWNGTLGVTETEGLQGPIGPFAHGTQTVVEALLGDFGNKPETIVGGGDTVGYIESRNLTDAFEHVSAGGGASLELMSGHTLPAVEALLDKK